MKTVKPKKVHVFVTERGKKTADIRLPYGMFRLGMKYGKATAKDETDTAAQTPWPAYRISTARSLSAKWQAVNTFCPVCCWTKRMRTAQRMW